MEITTLLLADLNPSTYNPRQDLKPDDHRYQALAKSLDEFGLVQPLVWNQRTKTLIGGHQRLKVLQARGETHTDVVVVNLTPEKEKALNLALNKVSGGWDQDKLAVLLEELTRSPEFDLQTTGFAIPEVEELLSGLGEDEDFDAEASIDTSTAAITQPGELLQLGLHGEHRILCGDATSSTDIAKLLGDHRARMLHTDPPYGVNYDPRKRRKLKGEDVGLSPRTGKIINDDLTPERYSGWFTKVVEQWKEALAPGSPIYVWNGRPQFGLMSDLLVQNDFHVSSVITWAKDYAPLSFGDYAEQTEFCVYGWKRGAPHRWYGPKNATSLWEVSRDRTDRYHHPTQKALALAERALRHSSKPDDIVLDPFLGSGTTLIAAARMRRRGFGLELDPHYCDVIVRRYIALAGRGAISEELAERYAEVRS